MNEPTTESPLGELSPAPVNENLRSAREPAVASASGTATATAPASTTAKGWPLALVALAATLAALVWLFWDTAWSMAETWYSVATYAHGLVVLPITLYMAWNRKAELIQITPRPAWGPLVLVAATALLWLTADLVGMQVVRHFAFVALVVFAVWVVLGASVSWALAFPLAYLFFMVPAGEFLTEPFMDYTTKATVWALQISGVPVYWEGRSISIPTGNWEVIEACSGVRYLTASLALGSLYAYLTYRSIWRRVFFIAASIAAPIIANWVRAYGVVMMGHLSSMGIGVKVDHIFFGWVFFGFVMVSLFWIGSFWREDTDDRSSAAKPGEGTSGSAAPARLFLLAGISVVVLAATGPLAAGVVSEWEARAGGVEVILPVATAPWNGPVAPTEAWSPTFPGSAQHLHGVYQREGKAVQAYAVLYLRERQGEELIGWGNALLDPKDWKALHSPRRVSVSLPGAGPATVEEVGYTSGRVQRLVWQWYDIAGWRTARPEIAKLLGAWARLTGNRSGYALVALAVDHNGKPDNARAVLTDLLASTPALVNPLERK